MFARSNPLIFIVKLNKSGGVAKALEKKSSSLYISPYFVRKGRIAQLVELLSYTQAVIGSSPVAPNIEFVMRE